MEKRKIPYKGRIESGNYKLERNGNGSCLLPLNGFDLFNLHREPSNRGNILVYTSDGQHYAREVLLASEFARNQSRYVALTTRANADYAKDAHLIINGLTLNFGKELLERYGPESNGNGKIIKMADDLFREVGYKEGKSIDDIARELSGELGRRLETAHS
ncbi:hypothetical protein J4221_02515 [Candidatus Pacearchaeota archaeon]|nr:hypothetical protein [Candidatus Pacearchaeota archaeon]